MDAPKLSVRDLEWANRFVESYGYHWEDSEDQNLIYSYYRQAAAFLQTLFPEEEGKFPPEIFDANQLGDVRKLLVYASSRNPDLKNIQKWSCAMLKVMHVTFHLNSDLYAAFESDIRSQILGPIKERIYQDQVQNRVYLNSLTSDERVRIHKLEIKPKKNQTSAVIKLLAKRRLVAMNILDRVGVRIVTRNTFDIFQSIRFLTNESLVCYPHAIVNESANSVYPTNLFLEAMDGLRSKNMMASEKEINEVLEKKLVDHQERAEYKDKDNVFTDANYKFVKFISRKLIRVKTEREGKKETIKFFYPFEVQIMDYPTYINNMRGPLSHEEYKKRQTRAARLRLLHLPDQGVSETID